jgi:hypothetical protein
MAKQYRRYGIQAARPRPSELSACAIAAAKLVAISRRSEATVTRTAGGLSSFRSRKASVEIRTGGSVELEADYALPVWAGVVP